MASVANVTNISQQAIRLMYNPIAADQHVSAFPAAASGELNIQSGSSAKIEEARLDPGQVESLKNKGLITVQVS